MENNFPRIMVKNMVQYFMKLIITYGGEIIMSEANMAGLHVKDYHIYLFSKAMKYLGNKDLSIAEIGCGAGVPLKYFISFLEKHGYNILNVYAFDIDMKYKEFFNRENIKFYRIDINKDKLPIRDNSIDVIIATEIIEHLLIPENLLSESYRVLKLGGLLLLSTPNIRRWVNILLLIAGFNPLTLDVGYYENYGQPKKYPTAGHIRGFTPRNLKHMLRAFKFEIMDLKTIPHPNRRFKLIDKIPSMLGLGYWICCCARKGRENELAKA